MNDEIEVTRIGESVVLRNDEGIISKLDPEEAIRLAKEIEFQADKVLQNQELDEEEA